VAQDKDVCAANFFKRLGWREFGPVRHARPIAAKLVDRKRMACYITDGLRRGELRVAGLVAERRAINKKVREDIRRSLTRRRSTSSGLRRTSYDDRQRNERTAK